MDSPTRTAQDVYDSLSRTQRSIEALVQFQGLLPDEDSNTSLVSCLIDGLEASYSELYARCFEYLANERTKV